MSDTPTLTDREKQLMGALRDVLDCLDAQDQVKDTTAYRGMGYNITIEKKVLADEP